MDKISKVSFFNTLKKKKEIVCLHVRYLEAHDVYKAEQE